MNCNISTSWRSNKQQTIKTTLNISYIVQDIDGTAVATYKIGEDGEENNLTAQKIVFYPVSCI